MCKGMNSMRVDNTPQPTVEWGSWKNHRILGEVRAMLHDQVIPLHLWVEAWNIAVYLQNQSPQWILGMITPEEDFSGRKSNLSHSNIFGASIYFHISKESRKNLELKIELGVFVGYTKTPHTYCVYFPSIRMIVVWRDVNFDEEKVLWCSLERELQIPPEEDLLALKEEPREVVEQPQIEE